MSTHKASTGKVQITKDGPYMVSGALPLSKQTIGANAAGESVKWIPGRVYPAQDSYALCRCGHSAKKPFCDGSHTKVKFNGTETASREPIKKRPRSCKAPPCRARTWKHCVYSRASATRMDRCGVSSMKPTIRTRGSIS